MKKVSYYILAILFVFLFNIGVFGANKVSTIDIQALIYEDGSIGITQKWEGTFDEGTENYIPLNIPDYVEVNDLKVADENGEYKTISNWDVEASFEEKAQKCGLRKIKSGYEICFGISEYGKNSYTISYELKNAVTAYSDYDGLNFCFVNDGMNLTPTDVTVLIKLADGTPIDDKMCDAWAFGFNGEVGFQEDGIFAYTKHPISQKEYVTILFSFEKGFLNPKTVVDSSFEDTKKNAFVGSDYSDLNEEDETNIAAMIITLVLILSPFAIIIVIIQLCKKRERKRLNDFSEKHGYWREVPNNGNRSATYSLGRMFGLCEDGAILGTGILRLIESQCLLPLKEIKTGLLGKTEEMISLKLEHPPNKNADEFDEYLYTVLEGAAGIDGILQKKELSKFVQSHSYLLRNYIDKCDNVGKNYLGEKGCLNKYKTPAKLKYLTQAGEKELGELIGFKRYLEDFSLIAERELSELPIWKECLSYALLFGIADRLLEQMKELYPNIASELEQYQPYVLTANTYSSMLCRSIHQAEERAQEQRSSGSGGAASFGGGGGSIGGGSGGGSR